MSASAAANPASRGFSLAWLSALTNLFTSLVSRVVGLCAGYRIKKKTLYIAVLERGGFDGRILWFHVDGRLICVESVSLCCFRNIRIREDGVLDLPQAGGDYRLLPQVVLASSIAEKAVKQVGRAV